MDETERERMGRAFLGFENDSQVQGDRDTSTAGCRQMKA
jgi:hypothetical protein